MQLAMNKVIIATAGSRKTSHLVKEALKFPDKRILILTYTLDNLKQIKDYFIDYGNGIPRNVTVKSWYSFLLSDCVRPYQNVLYDKKRIKTICFVQGKSVPYIRKTNVEKYYFQNGDKIFTDKISAFVCLCNEISKGLVIDRLESIYDSIYIDEIQDLAGYDFDFLELLFKSEIFSLIVGDNRQATYFTNCSPKNSKFKGENILNLFKNWEQNGLCSIEERNDNYRCNQMICDFSDKLYPEMTKTNSKNLILTEHDGIFILKKDKLELYIKNYSPILLRDTIKTKTEGYEAINFGVSKGQSFDRILIFPNGPIKKYLLDS